MRQSSRPNSHSPLWQQAAAFAARAHQQQFRRDKATPYFAHPVRVALTIACVFRCNDEEIIAAALLHDTIEDTPTDYDDIHENFGRRVADIVAAASKDMRMIEPEREAAYDRQLADGPWEARLVKLADVYDNLQDLVAKRPGRKVLQRAERILKLVESDERLAHPRSIVRDALRRVQRQKQ